MKTIFKYSFNAGTRLEVDMPTGSTVVHVGEQNDDVTIWAQVESDNPKESRVFNIVGTGRIIPTGLTRYLGTVLIGPYVWHVYERTI